jgi:LysM repeat protein
MGMVPDTRINLGFIYAGAHSCAAMDGDIAIQVTCKYPQHKGYRLARRRFVYYWEKDFIDDKWVRHGLAMTDDDGFLFDLKTFFKDTLQKKNSMTGTAHIVDWKIKKFDYNSRKWTSQPWNFFGSTEDVIAFQKWLGTPQLSSLTRENSEEKEYFINSQSFVHLDNNNQPIFKYHFLVPDKYLIKFKPGCDRFFMFCPPDIVNPELLRKQGGSGKPSFSVAGTGSNTDIDFEFLPEPKSEWFKHVYHVKPGDTLSDIAAKYGDTENRFLRVNASVTNPNRIKPGIALNVPRPMTDHDLYSREEFGTFASAGYVHGDVAHEEVLRTDRFPKMQENGRYLHSARILLSTNLEEHLSNLAFHTALLDLQYQQIVESSVPFMEAAGLVRQIGDTLELMHKYPGYKSRVPCPAPGMMPGDYNTSGGGLSTLRVMGGSDNYDSVYYEGKVDVSEGKKQDVLEIAERYQQYAEELSDAVWNSNNPVFKALSEDIYREIDNIEMIVTDREFYRRLEEWAGYELYAKDKPEYPFFLKVSVNALGSGTGSKLEAAPIIYRVIQDAFSLCLSLDFEQKPGKGEKEDTVADAFYKKAVAPFEDDLEMEFIKLDSVQKAKGEKSIGEKALETAKESGVELFDSGTGSDIVSNQYRLNVQHSKEEATVLQIVFMDLICKDILKGAPSYLQAVLMASTRCRSAAILAAVYSVNAVQASFAHLKVAVGKMVYMGSDSKAIALELEEGIREFSRSKKATLQKVYAKQQIARSRSAGFGKAPKPLSHMSTMTGAAFTIYDIAVFSMKYADEKTEVDIKDWIGLTKTLHGGGLLLTKFSFKWTNRFDKIFYSVTKKATKFLSKTAVVFICMMPYHSV